MILRYTANFRRFRRFFHVFIFRALITCKSSNHNRGNENQQRFQKMGTSLSTSEASTSNERFFLITTDEVPEDGFFSVDWYKHVFVNRLWVSALLSLECAVSNFILFATLLRLEDFRTWLLYPVFLQAFVDFIGPGIANCLSEFWSYQYVTEVMGRRQVMPVVVMEIQFRLETFSQCILQGSFV